MCRNLRPKSAGYWGMEADFVSFLARNRCTPPVTQAQFRAWARALGLPIAAYNNRAWLRCIPDVAHPADLRRLAGPNLGGNRMKRRELLALACSGEHVHLLRAP